jgi:hypothetical protein
MSFISQIINNATAIARGNWDQLKPLESESLERHIPDITAAALSVPLVVTIGIKAPQKVIALAALPPFAIIATLHLAQSYES